MSKDIYKDLLNLLNKFNNTKSEGGILVTQGEKTLFEKYYGNCSNSQFRIFSLSKPVVGVAIMTLIDKGLLTLDTSLEHLNIKIPFGDKITVMHLLNHTSGIRDIVQLLYFKKIPIEIFNSVYDKNSNEIRPLNFDQYLQLLNSSKPDHYPSHVHKYNNTGYDILGYIVYLVTGMKTTGYIRDNIFSKLNMVDATFHDEPIKKEVLPYDANHNRGVKEQYGFFGTSANMICSLRDYNNFLNGYESLLSNSTLEIYKKLYYFGVLQNSSRSITRKVFMHKGGGDCSRSFCQTDHKVHHLALSKSVAIKFLHNNINVIIYTNYEDQNDANLYMLNWKEGSVFTKLLNYLVNL